MHHKALLAMKQTTLNRVFHLVAMATLVIGLAPAVADAAPRKGTVAAKKSQTASKRVTRSFIVGKRVVAPRSVVRVAHVPARPSYGQIAGLHSVQDQLDL
jgi:serine-type D-Ala-D-Ala endopeptidase (penicillin-binding protein 7)